MVKLRTSSIRIKNLIFNMLSCLTTCFCLETRLTPKLHLYFNQIEREQFCFTIAWEPDFLLKSQTVALVQKMNFSLFPKINNNQKILL
jgi:hypothetical protein